MDKIYTLEELFGDAPESKDLKYYKSREYRARFTGEDNKYISDKPCRKCGGTLRYKKYNLCVPCHKRRSSDTRAKKYDRFLGKSNQ